MTEQPKSNRGWFQRFNTFEKDMEKLFQTIKRNEKRFVKSRLDVRARPLDGSIAQTIESVFQREHEFLIGNYLRQLCIEKSMLGDYFKCFNRFINFYNNIRRRQCRVEKVSYSDDNPPSKHELFLILNPVFLIFVTKTTPEIKNEALKLVQSEEQNFDALIDASLHAIKDHINTELMSEKIKLKFRALLDESNDIRESLSLEDSNFVKCWFSDTKFEQLPISATVYESDWIPEDLRIPEDLHIEIRDKIQAAEIILNVKSRLKVKKILTRIPATQEFIDLCESSEVCINVVEEAMTDEVRRYFGWSSSRTVKSALKS